MTLRRSHAPPAVDAPALISTVSTPAARASVSSRVPSQHASVTECSRDARPRAASRAARAHPVHCLSPWYKRTRISGVHGNPFVAKLQGVEAEICAALGEQLGVRSALDD